MAVYVCRVTDDIALFDAHTVNCLHAEIYSLNMKAAIDLLSCIFVQSIKLITCVTVLAIRICPSSYSSDFGFTGVSRHAVFQYSIDFFPANKCIFTSQALPHIQFYFYKLEIHWGPSKPLEPSIVMAMVIYQVNG